MTNITSILAVSDRRNPMKNVYRIEVIGKRGSFHGTRDTLTEARATARHYARLLDAPREVI